MRTFVADQTIIESAKDSSVIGYIESGIVKGTIDPRQDFLSRSIVGLYGSQTHPWFGFEAIAHGCNFVTYVSVTECRVKLFDAANLRAELSEDQIEDLSKAMAFQLSTHWAQRMVDRTDRRKRVLGTLIDIRRMTGMVEIPLTQSELGILIGLERARINESLKELEREGLVELGYRQILIPDEDVLITAFNKP